MEGATGSVLHGLARQLQQAQKDLAQAQTALAGCKRVVVHFKSLLPIDKTVKTFIDTQFTAMQALYAQGQIAVLRGTTEDLSGNVNLRRLQNINVGACLTGQPTADQKALFANRNNVGNNELVVYVVSTLIGGTGNFVGCATHPDGQPGAAVIQVAQDWVVAHEVGHVLGLSHVCEFAIPTKPPTPPPSNSCDVNPTLSDSLMWPTTAWTNVPPDLANSEYKKMKAGSFVKPF
jgi:hypothetical protein